MTKPPEKVAHHVAMDSQSIDGHGLILKKSLATAHHASLLRPAPPARETPQPQQTTNNSDGKTGK